jgi:uncharacterized membrane protein YkoI
MRASLRLQLPVLSLTFASLSLLAAEKRISKADLPTPVQKTADRQTKGGTVHGYSRELENEKVEYEVQAIVNGHDLDIAIAPDGTLIEIEEQISIDSLSPNVRSGLSAAAANGKITKVESLTKHGKIVAYEAQVMTAGKRSEVQVGPDGKGLDHEK